MHSLGDATDVAARSSDGQRAPSTVPPVGVRHDGRHVALRPIRAQDYEMLRVLELSAELVPLWRHQGTTPGLEQWVQGLWAGVLAQFLVVDKGRQGQPRGIVVAYSADFRHGFAYVGAMKFEPGDRSPLFLEGVGLFLDYVFTAWNFRKLYAETSELNLGQFGSGLGRLFVQEGCLRQHRFFAGRYWDQHTLAIYRETWAEVAASMSDYFG